MGLRGDIWNIDTLINFWFIWRQTNWRGMWSLIGPFFWSVLIGSDRTRPLYILQHMKRCEPNTWTVACPVMSNWNIPMPWYSHYKPGLGGNEGRWEVHPGSWKESKTKQRVNAIKNKSQIFVTATRESFGNTRDHIRVEAKTLLEIVENIIDCKELNYQREASNEDKYL